VLDFCAFTARHPPTRIDGSFTRGNIVAEFHSFDAMSVRWLAAFIVVYATEFLCLSAAKLPVPHAATRATQTRCRWQAAAVANRGHHRFLFS
jgi:hypothetical protein